MSQPLPPELSLEPYLALKNVMMPRDTNAYGTIFGGVLLSHIDQAGAVGVAHVQREMGWPLQPFVTVGVEKVEFHEPVHVGDVVSYWTRVLRVGTTSITMEVVVLAESPARSIKVTEARLTFVTVSESAGHRHPVPLRGTSSQQ